jgi:hypothetical protein
VKATDWPFSVASEIVHLKNRVGELEFVLLAASLQYELRRPAENREKQSVADIRRAF